MPISLKFAKLWSINHYFSISLKDRVCSPMQNQQFDYQRNITLYLDESSAFNRHLLSLIKQWDKRRSIDVHYIKADHLPSFQSKSIPLPKKHKQFYNDTLQVVDNNGSSFEGAEAVPIILKHLPFGKLAAAFYILPGTMWVTKQLYSLPFTH